MATATSPRTWHGSSRSATRYRTPLILLGVGLGGFIDGIVLHQILQWHHMISDTASGNMATLAGLEKNTLADGLFHMFAFAVVLVSLWLAIRTKRADPRAVLPGWGVIIGWLLIGWGAFNLVEGVVDHHVLRVHHVRDDVADPLPWDLAFLAISAALVGVGMLLSRPANTGKS